MDTPPTIILNPLQCLFTDDIHGKQCICQHCTAYHLIDSEGVQVCDDCGHLANAHPEVLEPKSTATSMIKAYRDGQRCQKRGGEVIRNEERHWDRIVLRKLGQRCMQGKWGLGSRTSAKFGHVPSHSHERDVVVEDATR